MPFELVTEDEMAVKSKKMDGPKKVSDTKKADIVVTKKDNIHLVYEEKVEGEKVGNTDNVEIKAVEKKVTPSINPNIIVKRIYFPDDTYSMG